VPSSLKRLAPLLCCAALLLASAARAAEDLEGFSATRLTRLHRFMQQATDSAGYLGAVTLVMRHGRVVDWRAYGSRDLARSAPMPRDAIFRIYSMTKTITSIAVLMLMEEGRLGLDDPVARYLPAFASMQVSAGGTADTPVLRPARRPITLRHLLTHTAGFATTGVGAVEAADLRNFTERLARVPLAADPGQRFAYDGMATETLARVVEVVSGLPFERFLQQRVFEPLDMRDTGFSVPPAQRARIADLTVMGDDARLKLADTPSATHPGEPLKRYPSGAGGLYSTVADYARLCQMLLDGGRVDGVSLLGRKTVALMMMNHLVGMLDPPVTSFSDAEGFGLGGSVLLDPARRGRPGSLGQFGWAGHASTTFTIDPQEQMIAILLMQHLPRDDGPDLPRLAARFYTLVYQALE
jgi:CubicO group peptidase (beta-lactamase class C family)